MNTSNLTAANFADLLQPESLPISFIQPFMNTPWMQRYDVLPLRRENNRLIIAISGNHQEEIKKAIQFHTETPIVFVNIPEEKMQQLRKKLLEVLNQKQHFAANDFVEQLIQEAIQKKASDIHFEPYEKSYRVRFRLDGLLSEITSAPRHMMEQMTAYLKVLAHLDTAEKRLPQDGRFQSNTVNGQSIDCRISTCPVVNGEKIVIRLLHRASMQRNMDDLGLNESQRIIFLEALKKTQGMIFVTGPTGSGKTVTLYTALSYLNSPERNISTIEEPVEIQLPGINQVGVNLKIGLTFAKAIRTFLRQDPDVIMIGEIRDLETAQIAISAAQTGHLVLSTLHANGAVETISRLLHMGIPAFQIADSVKLIIAQRLARKLCEFCRSPHLGCSQCHQGYKGQIGLFEILPITPQFSDKIATGIDTNTLSNFAKQSGMMSLYEAGTEKVNAGLTTLEEIQRII